MSGPIVRSTIPPTTVIWPATLPQQPLVRGFTATEPVLTLRQGMDAGPEKVRQRFTAGTTKITCHYIMNPSQLQDLRAFYAGPAGGGAVMFAWPGPPPYGTEQPVRFTSPPQWSPVDNGQVWDAQIEVEIIPPQLSTSVALSEATPLPRLGLHGPSYLGSLGATLRLSAG